MTISLIDTLQTQLGRGRVFALDNPTHASSLNQLMKRDLPALREVENQQPQNGFDQLPTFIFRDSLPLKDIDGVPQYYGPLRSLGRGRLSEDRSRLYVRACRQDGTSVWISKRVSDGCWFLEGIFV